MKAVLYSFAFAGILLFTSCNSEKSKEQNQKKAPELYEDIRPHKDTLPSQLIRPEGKESCPASEFC
jgi:hypothetical protein